MKFRKKFKLILSLVSLIMGFSVVDGVFATEIEDIPDFDPGVVIVALKDNAVAECSTLSDLDIVSIDTLMSVDTLTTVNQKDIESTPSTESTKIIKVTLESKESEAVLQAVEELNNSPQVIVAQPDYYAFIEDTRPNDEFYDSLYGMEKIDAPKAWEKFTGSDDVVVGIMDTGIDYTHSDLKDNIWINPNPNAFKYSDNGVEYAVADDIHGWNFYDNNAQIMDENRHGTHVAGIVGASGNNDIGVTGVNWNVSLASLKVCSARGSTKISSMISALAYANQHEIRIINCSLGWYEGRFKDEENDALCIAIKGYNGLFITSAGNNSSDNNVTMHYPSGFNLPNLICVGATDKDDNNVYNHGTNTVYLGAPGYEILSTAISTQPDSIIGNDGSKYIKSNGTSMATPYVTGAAALLMGYRPNLSMLDIKNIIINSTDKIPQLEDKYISGGRLNIANMLKMAEKDNINMSFSYIIHNNMLSISSINLQSEETYRNCDVYFIIERYSVNNSKLTSATGTIHIDQLGNGTFINIPENILFESSNEHLVVKIYGEEICETLITRKLLYPTLFEF